MIRVTTLRGEELVLNALFIETVKAEPDTIIHLYAQLGQQGLVLGGQGGEVVRAKDAPPLHGPPAVAGVAAQVPKVGGACEGEGSGGGLLLLHGACGECGGWGY